MSYLKIISLEIIDTNKEQELFVASDAKGIAVCIKQVGLMNDDGSLNRMVKLNESLLTLLKSTKIKL